MGRMEAAFLGLLSLGILTLVAGLMLTRLYWRQDMPPFGRRTRLLDVALHPEAYTSHAPLPVIRCLNLGGGLLLTAAAIVVAYETLRTALRQ